MKRSIVCRCEDISEEDVIQAIDEGYTDIEELRKKLRIGMGPCQGGFCTFRALGIMNDMSVISPEQSMEMLRGFLQRRFRGIRYALWGDQLREEQLVEYIYLGILAMEKPQ